MSAPLQTVDEFELPDPLWPLREPPEIPDGTSLDKDKVDLCIADWLLRAIRQALPPEVISIFFTALRGSDSHLETDVPLILGEKASGIVVGRFAWMVGYNIKHRASLLQSLHRSEGKIDRSAMVLSSQPPPPSFHAPLRSAVAWATLSGDTPTQTPLDSIKMPNGERISIREYVDAAIEEESTGLLTSTTKAKGDFYESKTPETLSHLRDVVERHVLSNEADPYRSRVWPLLEVAQVLMVMAPAYEARRDRRLELGSCGLNLLIDPSTAISRDLIETAFGLIRTLDSLFGTVQHLHRATLRDRLSYEAMNIIAHSFKNRADRLTTAYPECARDLYVQKLSCTGAGKISSEPAKINVSGRPAAWNRAGFKGESLTESLRTTIWKSKGSHRLDLKIIENRIADARWVTLLEELMSNLEKRHKFDSCGEILLSSGAYQDTAIAVVSGTVWPEHWKRIKDDLESMLIYNMEIDFGGLSAVMAMVNKLRTEDTQISYVCGTKETDQSPIDSKTFRVYNFEVDMIQLSNFPDEGFLPFLFTATNLQIPPPLDL